MPTKPSDAELIREWNQRLEAEGLGVVKPHTHRDNKNLEWTIVSLTDWPGSEGYTDRHSVHLRDPDSDNWTAQTCWDSDRSTLYADDESAIESLIAKMPVEWAHRHAFYRRWAETRNAAQSARDVGIRVMTANSWLDALRAMFAPNRPKKKGTPRPYRLIPGVSKLVKPGPRPWRAQPCYEGVAVYLGVYPTEAAAEAAIVRWRETHPYPTSAQRWSKPPGPRRRSWRPGGSRPFRARVYTDGKQHHLGSYATQAEADEVCAAFRALHPYVRQRAT